MHTQEEKKEEEKAYFYAMKEGTKKPCHSIELDLEQVQEARRSKKKPFHVLENDSEKYSSSL